MANNIIDCRSRCCRSWHLTLLTRDAFNVHSLTHRKSFETRPPSRSARSARTGDGGAGRDQGLGSSARGILRPSRLTTRSRSSDLRRPPGRGPARHPQPHFQTRIELRKSEDIMSHRIGMLDQLLTAFRSGVGGAPCGPHSSCGGRPGCAPRAQPLVGDERGREAHC